MPVLNNSRLNSCFEDKVGHNSVRQMNDTFKPDQEICVSLHSSQVAHQAGAYPGFRSMKRLRVFILSPGWDASPSQGYPQH